MRLAWLLIGVTLSCSARRPPIASEASEAITTERIVYVDERALQGGDGSRERPFRALQHALPADAGVVIELASGLYEGPFELSAGVTLRSRTQPVVLHSNADVVVEALGGTLQDVLVQGGQVGVRSSGQLTLSGVGFSGQRQAALDVVGGAVSGANLHFDASISETMGLLVRGGAEASVEGGVWKGPFRRGVDLQGGALELKSVRFKDSVVALHVRAGVARVKGATASGGRGPAFVVGAAKLTLEVASVEGHEYGLLAGKDAEVRVNIFEARGTERAAVALTAASGSLEGIGIRKGGSFGSIQLTQSNVSLKGIRVAESTVAGVVINGGNVSVEDAEIRSIRNVDGSSGDGIVVRSGTVTLKNVTVSGAEGAGIVCGNAAETQVVDVRVSGAAHGAFVADYKGKLAVKNAVVDNIYEAVFVAIEGASLTVDGARIDSTQDNAALAWVECATGATMKLAKIVTALAPPPSECLEVELAP